MKIIVMLVEIFTVIMQRIVCERVFDRKRLIKEYGTSWLSYSVIPACCQDELWR